MMSPALLSRPRTLARRAAGAAPLLAALALHAPGLAAPPGGGVTQTRHNLSVSGPGEIRALDETRICIFCHTSHSAQPGKVLWNRDLPATTFRTYESPSLDAKAIGGGQPNGTSKLCLSCHDGTVALGAVLSRRQSIAMRGTSGGRLPATARGFLGRDLRGTHPISFQISDQLIARNNTKDSQIKGIAAIKADPDVKLDRFDRMQCTTCHDPHSDANFQSSGVHFYRKARFSDVCKVCHVQ